MTFDLDIEHNDTRWVKL